MRILHSDRCEKCNGKGKIVGMGRMTHKCVPCHGVGRIERAMPKNMRLDKPRFDQAKFERADVPAGDGGGGEAGEDDESSSEPDEHGKKKKKKSKEAKSGINWKSVK